MGHHPTIGPGVPETVRAVWAGRLARCAARLHQARLHGMALALLDAGEPLGPLGAQMLWIAQPALGLIAPRSEIDGLARILEAPGGVAWVREHLGTPSSDGE